MGPGLRRDDTCFLVRAVPYAFAIRFPQPNTISNHNRINSNSAL